MVLCFPVPLSLPCVLVKGSQHSDHMLYLLSAEPGLRGKAVCTFRVTCWKEHWIQDQEAWMLALCQPLTGGEIIITVIATFIHYLL